MPCDVELTIEIRNIFAGSQPLGGQVDCAGVDASVKVNTLHGARHTCHPTVSSHRFPVAGPDFPD